MYKSRKTQVGELIKAVCYFTYSSSKTGVFSRKTMTIVYLKEMIAAKMHLKIITFWFSTSFQVIRAGWKISCKIYCTLRKLELNKYLLRKLITKIQSNAKQVTLKKSYTVWS